MYIVQMYMQPICGQMGQMVMYMLVNMQLISGQMGQLVIYTC